MDPTLTDKLKAIQREKIKLKTREKRKRGTAHDRDRRDVLVDTVSKSEAETAFETHRRLWDADAEKDVELDVTRKARVELSIRLERIPSGEDVREAPLAESWDDPRLPSQFRTFYHKVARLKGWESPTPVQRQLWPLMLQGHDVAVISPTGTGKTLAFCLPAVPHILVEAADRRFQGPIVLVLAPTRELVLQISHACRRFYALFEIHVVSMIGGHGSTAAGSSNRDDGGEHLAMKHDDDDDAEQGGGMKKKKKKNQTTTTTTSVNRPPRPNSAAEGTNPIPPNLSDVDILVCTPGRCVDLVRNKDVSFKNTSILVLDEADRLFNMGFKAQINEISAKVPGNRQTILTSATSSGEANAVAEAWLKPSHLRVLIGTLDVKVELGHRKSNSSNATTTKTEAETEEEPHHHNPPAESDVTLAKHVCQTVHVCSEQKKPRNLLKHLEELRSRETNPRNPSPVVVFCNRIKTVLFVYETLVKHNERAVALHGQMAQPLRERALQLFRAGKYTVLVCTDVAARGLDIPSVGHVIQYDFPASLAVYAHRVGRAGRGPKWQSGGATCLSLFTRNFGCMAPDLIGMLESAGQEVGADLREVARDAVKEAGADEIPGDKDFVPNEVEAEAEDEEEEPMRNEDRDVVGVVPLGKSRVWAAAGVTKLGGKRNVEEENVEPTFKRKRERRNIEEDEDAVSIASSSSSSSTSSSSGGLMKNKFKRPRGKKRGGRRANKKR